MIHFKLIFMFDVKKGLEIIPPSKYLVQAHLLKERLLNFLNAFIKSRLTQPGLVQRSLFTLRRAPWRKSL